MGLFKKKTPKVTTPEPVHYPIELGQKVTLTITGYWDGQRIYTPRDSYFHLPAGLRQTDPDVWVEPCEDII